MAYVKYWMLITYTVVMLGKNVRSILCRQLWLGGQKAWAQVPRLSTLNGKQLVLNNIMSGLRVWSRTPSTLHLFVGDIRDDMKYSNNSFNPQYQANVTSLMGMNMFSIVKRKKNYIKSKYKRRNFQVVKPIKCSIFQSQFTWPFEWTRTIISHTT